MKKRRKAKTGCLGPVLALVVMAVLAAAVLQRRWFYRTNKSVYDPSQDPSMTLVTGYCDCEKCCGWERSDDGDPVYGYGPMKGKPKKIGVTASGKKAKHGTIAADRAFYKFGTKLFIPGYGAGVVEDVGGAIKGRRHLDVWFENHETALKWGRRWLKVEPIADGKTK